MKKMWSLKFQKKSNVSAIWVSGEESKSRSSSSSSSSRSRTILSSIQRVREEKKVKEIEKNQLGIFPRLFL